MSKRENNELSLSKLIHQMYEKQQKETKETKENKN